MTRKNIIKAITGIINSVENKKLIEINGTEIGGYKIIFNAIVGGKELVIAEQLGEDAFDKSDIALMKKTLHRTYAQLGVILKEVRDFAERNLSIGKWTIGGVDLSFRYEVIADGVIEVA